MKKISWLIIAGIIIFMAKPVFDLINNLIWLSQQSPLPKEQLPFGIFSAPGGGLLVMGIILITVFGGGAFVSIWSRRPR